MKYIKLYEDFNTNETQQFAVLQHAKNLDKKRKDDEDDDYTPPKSKPFQYKGPEETEGEGEIEETEGDGEIEETEEDY